MRFPSAPKWSALRWLLPLMAGMVFVGGLVYAYFVSEANSKNLALIQEEVYPFLEKTGFLKSKLKSIQAGFYYAVTQSDLQALERLKNEEEEFLRAFMETETFAGDKEPLRLGIDLSREYFSAAEEVSRGLIENPGNIIEAQSSVSRMNEKGRSLAEKIEEMNRGGIDNFKKALSRSQENSSLMLNIGLVSVIFGIFLVGSFSSLNIFLNRKLSSANRNLESEVKSRTAELESVIYTMSHDLKSPIVAMQGMAAVFLEDYSGKVDDRGRHYLQRIVENGNYMEDLIQDLLSLSRVGKPTSPELVDARGALQKVLDIHQGQFAEKEIRIDVQPNFPQFVFERSQLTELFQNLITNAVKFIGDQPFPIVEIGGKESTGWVEFYVKDNGIGIDPAYHDKVFGLFQTLKEVEVEGTGVGLSIVKKIIDLAGGKIWIESKKGEGTTFFVRFPRKAI